MENFADSPIILNDMCDNIRLPAVDALYGQKNNTTK